MKNVYESLVGPDTDITQPIVMGNTGSTIDDHEDFDESTDENENHAAKLRLIL